MYDLTKRERDVFDFVFDELEQGSASPSLAEIGEEFGFHTSNAWRIVFALMNKGYLHRPAGRHRALEITELGHAYRSRIEAEHARRRRAGAGPTVTGVLASIRAQLGRLREGERAAVLAELAV